MRTKLFTVALAAVLVVPTTAWAQSTASSDLTVTATVIKGLTLTNVNAASLAFGKVAQGGTKTIDPKTAGVKFLANGEANTTLTVTAPATATLSATGGSLTFSSSVTAYATDAQSSSTTITGNSVTLDASGNYYFWVGGSISPTTSTATGDYTGTWTLTVAYSGI